MSDNKIFVSLAAYRDPELAQTVLLALENADNPDRLRFGVCWQRKEGEDDYQVNGIAGLSCLRLDVVDYRESKGTCWARNRTFQLWQGERWWLQIDSHCKFDWQWDVTLLEQMAQAQEQSILPVLSAYCPAYEGDRLVPFRPHRVGIQAFHDNGMCKRSWDPVDGMVTPVIGFTVLAGFLFGDGRICERVPYDPSVYFDGEEISFAARLWTHGYDIFHPTKLPIYHNYSRHNAIRHWSDHSDWGQLARQSDQRVTKMLSEGIYDRHGLGHLRSLESYWHFSGINFRNRTIEPRAVAGIPLVSQALMRRDYRKAVESSACASC
jgi:hypothetical protein